MLRSAMVGMGSIPGPSHINSNMDQSLASHKAGGGGYSDHEADALRVRAQLEKCAKLVQVAEGAAGPFQRLIVLESDFREIGLCEWMPPSLDSYDASEWLNDLCR
jgi:hypothetical protein